MILHDYWRSSAAYRVRIALNLKGLGYSQIAHDLRRGEQSAVDYRAIAPQGLIPAIEVDDVVLVQSMAIIEWLDEAHPEPRLLPNGAGPRAIVRAMAEVIACDIHPVNNLRILKALKADFGAGQDAIDTWVRRWIGDGFAALETMVGAHGGQFCYGDLPGMADVMLVPQWYNAERFATDLSPYPRLAAVVAAARALPAFDAARPEAQPDAD